MYISLTNIGNDSARFKIRQPSTESGATVRYQPGPVAPGMKLKVLVELDARSATIAKKSKEIKTTFQVVTEAEVLHIPISAGKSHD